MPETGLVAEALLAFVDNQVARTVAALKGMREDVFTVEPGNEARSISEVGRHMLHLRKMQLKILGPSVAQELGDPAPITSVDDLRRKLARAAKLVREAVTVCDVAALFHPPKQGDRAPMAWLAQTLNDFTSHVGDVRTIRRILGNPVA